MALIGHSIDPGGRGQPRLVVVDMFDKMSNKHLIQTRLSGGAETFTSYLANMAKGRPSNAKLTRNKSLALAQEARLKARKDSVVAVVLNADTTENKGADDESSGSEVECTGWSGGLAHYISSDEEPIFIGKSEEEEGQD